MMPSAEKSSDATSTVPKVTALDSACTTVPPSRFRTLKSCASALSMVMLPPDVSEPVPLTVTAPAPPSVMAPPEASRPPTSTDPKVSVPSAPTFNWLPLPPIPRSLVSLMVMIAPRTSSVPKSCSSLSSVMLNKVGSFSAVTDAAPLTTILAASVPASGSASVSVISSSEMTCRLSAETSPSWSPPALSRIATSLLPFPVAIRSRRPPKLWVDASSFSRMSSFATSEASPVTLTAPDALSRMLSPALATSEPVWNAPPKTMLSSTSSVSWLLVPPTIVRSFVSSISTSAPVAVIVPKSWLELFRVISNSVSSAPCAVIVTFASPALIVPTFRSSISPPVWVTVSEFVAVMLSRSRVVVPTVFAAEAPLTSTTFGAMSVPLTSSRPTPSASVSWKGLSWGSAGIGWPRLVFSCARFASASNVSVLVPFRLKLPSRFSTRPAVSVSPLCTTIPSSAKKLRSPVVAKSAKIWI